MPTYYAAKRFLEAFEAQFGSINCRELNGSARGTYEGANGAVSLVVRF
ncbi:MAG: hypothetical protein ACLQPD_05825 [Desulfomonilaceae bacterium]